MRESRRRLAIRLLVGLALTGCGSRTPAEPEPGPLPPDFVLHAVEIASGLAQPVHLTTPPDDSRLFIVEQPGRIRIVENGALLPTPFLDIAAQVVSGGERGLLSVAFHPQYASNGFLYVNYTGAGGETRVERYRVSSDRNRADPASARLVLSVPQPFANHNGGLVKFGPDGMLYIGMGDGGSGGDPLEHGQNPGTLLGALLRIDVDGAEPYRVPPDNPFVGSPGARPESWAIGLRNPWRFSFDPESGLLYIADVGQNRREEINAQPAAQGGLNYGWNVMEGSTCFRPPAGCDSDGLVLPLHEYPNPSQGCSVTGGYVYRGSIPELRGHYFFGDYCRGTVRSFRRTAQGDVADLREWDLGTLGSISSFGVDASGELYVVAHQGRVFRLER
jgi:glucose/arabinose dehydrogenase